MNACDQTAINATRIAVAGGSITEILYFLGEQNRIIAVDTTSNYPLEAKKLPSVGYVRALSTEGLLSLNPSLIIGENDMGPPSVINQVRNTNIEIITLPEENTTNGILQKIRCVAKIIGTSENAENLIEENLLTKVASLNSIKRKRIEPIRIAVLLGVRDGLPFGAGLNTSGDGLISMIGANNAFIDFNGWKPISIETMVAANPDYIVVPKRGVDSAGGKEKILSHPAIKFTNAAKFGNLITMDGMSMLGFGPRTIDAALKLANQVQKKN